MPNPPHANQKFRRSGLCVCFGARMGSRSFVFACACSAGACYRHGAGGQFVYGAWSTIIMASMLTWCSTGNGARRAKRGCASQYGVCGESQIGRGDVLVGCGSGAAAKGGACGGGDSYVIWLAAGGVACAVVTELPPTTSDDNDQSAPLQPVGSGGTRAAPSGAERRRGAEMEMGDLCED